MKVKKNQQKDPGPRPKLLALDRQIDWSHVLSQEGSCSWNNANRQFSNYIWVINNFISKDIWGFTVPNLSPKVLSLQYFQEN